MSAWKIQDAKARFSAFVKASVEDGPQTVTRHGVETAVLVSIDDWKRLKKSDRQGKNIKDVLLAPEPKFDFDLPDRKSRKIRYDTSWLTDE